jgi:hypothetical protein
VQPLLDPTLDVVFKLLFTGHDDAHEALLGLLTAVLRPTQPIASVERLDPSVGVGLHDIDDKSIVLDVRVHVRFGNGTTLDVEMQARNVVTFRARLLSHWARLFGGQLRAGDGYGSLRPTISIAQLSYLVTRARNPRFHSVFRIIEVDDHVPCGDALTIHFVQLARLGEAAASADRAPELRGHVAGAEHGRSRCKASPPRTPSPPRSAVESESRCRRVGRVHRRSSAGSTTRRRTGHGLRASRASARENAGE